MVIFNLGKNNLKKALKKSIEAIKNGEVLVCPTDTVYGLICDAGSKKAVNRLFKIKERSRRKPVPIFIKNIKTAKKLAYINKNQEKFLNKAWPGKITAVLKRKTETPKRKIYGVDKKTIALRIPKQKFIGCLMSVAGSPLTETSANISGRRAPTKFNDVLRQFKNKKYQPDLLINTGNLRKSRPSKVIDLTVLPFKVLRK